MAFGVFRGFADRRTVVLGRVTLDRAGRCCRSVGDCFRLRSLLLCEARCERVESELHALHDLGSDLGFDLRVQDLGCVRSIDLADHGCTRIVVTERNENDLVILWRPRRATEQAGEYGVELDESCLMGIFHRTDHLDIDRIRITAMPDLAAQVFRIRTCERVLSHNFGRPLGERFVQETTQIEQGLGHAVLEQELDRCLIRPFRIRALGALEQTLTEDVIAVDGRERLHGRLDHQITFELRTGRVFPNERGRHLEMRMGFFIAVRTRKDVNLELNRELGGILEHGQNGRREFCTDLLRHGFPLCLRNKLRADHLYTTSESLSNELAYVKVRKQKRCEVNRIREISCLRPWDQMRGSRPERRVRARFDGRDLRHFR